MESCPEILDGGMGTLLQERGLKAGETPEDWNVERPDDIAAIHRAYVAAGSEIVYANTFGANPLKYRGRHDLAKVIRAGLQIARRATLDERRTTGRLLKPAGDLDFDDAVAAFAETIRVALGSNKAGAKSPEGWIDPKDSKDPIFPDLIVIETMGDVRELKAAVIAAKENCNLPVYATVALGEDGKLLTGGTVESVAALLESLGVDAYGLNCGLGPDLMLESVERLAKVSTKPIIVKPNAGIPKVEGGRTVFTVGPDEFAVTPDEVKEVFLALWQRLRHR